MGPLEHSGDSWIPSPAEHPAHVGVSRGAEEPQTPWHALGDGNRGREGTPAREAAGPTCVRAGGQAGRTKLPFHLRGAIRAVTRDVPSRDVPAYQRLPPSPAPRGGSGGGDGVVVFAQPCLPWLFFFFFFFFFFLFSAKRFALIFLGPIPRVAGVPSVLAAHQAALEQPGGKEQRVSTPSTCALG